MSIGKDSNGLGMPWEDQYGYAQAVRVDDTIYVSGQVSHVVDETLFVTDMDAAFEAAVACRKEVFSGMPVVASTIVEINRLAFPEFMIEIRCVAKV